MSHLVLLILASESLSEIFLRTGLTPSYLDTESSPGRLHLPHCLRRIWSRHYSDFPCRHWERNPQLSAQQTAPLWIGPPWTSPVAPSPSSPLTTSSGLTNFHNVCGALPCSWPSYSVLFLSRMHSLPIFNPTNFYSFFKIQPRCFDFSLGPAGCSFLNTWQAPHPHLSQSPDHCVDRLLLSFPP